jgi:hypothetical protein
MPIRNLTEEVTDEHIENVLQEMLGKDDKQIHYLQVHRTHMKIGANSSIPIIHLIYGTPGYLIGRENTIWYFNALSPFATDDEIKNGFREAFAHAREVKAKQAAYAAAQNGQDPGK